MIHDTRGESLALTSFFAKTWAVSEKSRIFAIVFFKILFIFAE